MASDTVVVSADSRLLISPAASRNKERREKDKKCVLRCNAPRNNQARAHKGDAPAAAHAGTVLCVRRTQVKVCFWCVCHNRLLMLHCTSARVYSFTQTFTPQTQKPTP